MFATRRPVAKRSELVLKLQCCSGTLNSGHTPECSERAKHPFKAKV
jgi:hypothetical protein